MKYQNIFEKTKIPIIVILTLISKGVKLICICFSPTSYGSTAQYIQYYLIQFNTTHIQYHFANLNNFLPFYTILSLCHML